MSQAVVLPAVAPLVSAARFIPTAAPISVLQAPTTPVDQPVRAAESIVGAESYVSTFAAASPATFAAPQPTAMPQQVQAVAARQPQISASQASTPPNVAGALAAALNPIAESPTAQNPAAHGSAMHSPVATALASHAVGAAHAPAAHDPAALDTLARQLYGRFSRHLAGELLIDRERSQFLTDLN